MKSSVRRPSRSISQRPTKVKTRLVTADADRLQERGLRAEAGKFKDAGSEIEDRVDAGKLVEKSNQDGEQGSAFEGELSRNVPKRPAPTMPAAIESASSVISAGETPGCDPLQNSQSRPRDHPCGSAASAGFREGRSRTTHRAATERRRLRASSARHFRQCRRAARWKRKRSGCRKRC